MDLADRSAFLQGRGALWLLCFIPSGRGRQIFDVADSSEPVMRGLLEQIKCDFNGFTGA